MLETEYENMLIIHHKIRDELKTKYWPSVQECLEMENDVQRFLPFAIYLVETGKGEYAPKTPEEIESRRFLYNFINAHLDIDG